MTALAKVVAAVVADLTEAGIAIHDCHGPARPLGGCCLTPTTAEDKYPPGVIVSWTCADTLAEGRPDGDRWPAYNGVQDTMTEPLWRVLESFGFPVVPFGQRGLPLVTGMRPTLPASDRPWEAEDVTGESVQRGGVPPVYGAPLYGEVIDVDGHLGRCCASCGRPFAALHYPQARESSGVCCLCWDGQVLVASDDHPGGKWVRLGRCDGHHPGEEGTA